MAVDMERMISALGGGCNAIIDYVCSYDNKPLLESKAITELGDGRYHKAVANAYSGCASQ
jgi:hypothetical protein